jgi:hypothetical protein
MLFHLYQNEKRIKISILIFDTFAIEQKLIEIFRAKSLLNEIND